MKHTLYQDLQARFRTKNGRTLNRRKLANNTYLEHRDDDRLAVKLHDTDIITVDPFNYITLNTDGWLTVTTKDRLSQFLPDGFGVYSDKGRWYLTRRGLATPYFDGLRISNNGAVINDDEGPDVEAQDAHNKRVRKLIDDYVDGFTPEKIVEAFEYGSGGDCWYCVMRDQATGKPLGDSVGDTSHLLGHLEERYYMLSLYRNAVEAAGYGNPDFILGSTYSGARAGRVPWYVRKTLKSYFRKRLLQGVATK